MKRYDPIDYHTNGGGWSWASDSIMRECEDGAWVRLSDIPTKPPLPTLDKWDHAVIFYVKQDKNPTIAGVKKIWAQRNIVDINYISSGDITNHLAELLEKIHQHTEYRVHSTREIIERMNPYNDIYYSGFIEGKRNGSIEYYWDRALAVYLTVFIHMESKYLPGFNEYFDEVKKKENAKG